jgi:tRNA-binding EMAP/Myf-like protein
MIASQYGRTVKIKQAVFRSSQKHGMLLLYKTRTQKNCSSAQMILIPSKGGCHQ